MREIRFLVSRRYIPLIDFGTGGNSQELRLSVFLPKNLVCHRKGPQNVMLTPTPISNLFKSLNARDALDGLRILRLTPSGETISCIGAEPLPQKALPVGLDVDTVDFNKGQAAVVFFGDVSNDYATQFAKAVAANPGDESTWTRRLNPKQREVVTLAVLPSGANKAKVYVGNVPRSADSLKFTFDDADRPTLTCWLGERPEDVKLSERK